jgi:hypothetical protein
VQRIGLIACGIEECCKALEARFKPPPLEAFARFNAIRYSVEDYKNRRSITDYLATLEYYAKACGQGLMDGDNVKFGMVWHTWIHLDPIFRETMDEPLLGTSLQQFYNTLLWKQPN